MNAQKAQECIEKLIDEESAKEDWDGIILQYAREALIALKEPEEKTCWNCSIDKASPSCYNPNGSFFSPCVHWSNRR